MKRARLPGNSRPEPDLTLLRWRDDYFGGELVVGSRLPAQVAGSMPQLNGFSSC